MTEEFLLARLGVSRVYACKSSQCGARGMGSGTGFPKKEAMRACMREAERKLDLPN